ncbi:MAG: Hpt domain-containing protein, partial [Parachlamydiaceae bacterium]
MDDFQITPEILEQFQVESRENIKDAENALLLIEKSGHVNSAIHDLFRPIHTIKGSAAYLELKDLNVLSHAFENILDGLRKREQMPISSDLINLFFKILDAIALMVDQAGATSFEAVSFNHLLEELSQLKLPSEKNDVQDGSKASSSTHQRIDVENRTLKVFLDSVGQQREVLLFVLNSLKLNPSLDSTMKVKVSRALQGIRNASKFIGEEKLENLSGDLRGWLLFSDGSDDI